MGKDTDLTAVVTGASRGIGKGIALALGRRRATVYVVGRTKVSAIRRFLQAVRLCPARLARRRKR